MQELLTVPNVLNMLMLVVAWSINRELAHIRESIDDAKKYAADAMKAAEKAHGRIDSLMGASH